MREKLRSRRGESLTETLVAILVVALAALLLATMTTGAVRAIRAGNEAVAALYDERSAAEAGEAARAGRVTIDFELAQAEDVAVLFSGEADGLAAYSLAEGGAQP